MSISNTVSLSTDLNVTPYYDDFDESKNFHRILYRPGLAVQARELTQMQSIMQNQIDRFAEHIFKEGTPVRGLQTNYENNLNFVKINDNDTAGADANTAAFVGTKITGSTSGLTAIVKAFKPGSEAAVPNTKTLYVDYTRSLANGTSQFLSGETLTSNASINCVVVTQNSTSGPVVGTGSRITFREGVLFAKDHFIRVPEQSIILGRYFANTTLRVGYDINETIRQQENDTTLLDPAQGSYNYAAPGADRLQLTANLVSKSITVAGVTSANTSNNFVEMFRTKDGQISKRYTDTQYNVIDDYFARRTYDESGNYIVKGLTARSRFHLKSGDNQGVFTTGNTDTLSIDISPGKAYVSGYETKILQTQHVQIDKGIDTVQVDDQSFQTNYGNFVIVKNVVGTFDINGHDQVSLRSKSMQAIANNTFSNQGPSGTELGTARVRSLEVASGTRGDPNCTYNLYLYDLNLSANNFSYVRSVSFGGGAANAYADAVLVSGNAVINDTEFNTSVFDMTQNGIKTLRDASDNKDNEYRFNKSFDVTIATDGTFTVATGASDEQFVVQSGALNSSQEKDLFHIVSTGTANTTTGVTGSMTNGANTVTGVTGAANKFNVGDVINIATYANTFVVSSVGSTTLSTLENNVKQAGLSGQAITKFIDKGAVIGLNGVGGTGAARSATAASATSTSFDIKETLNQTLGARVFTQLKQVDGQEKAKVINKNRVVQLYISNNVSGNTGPWNLGVSDGHKLNSVLFKAGARSANTTDGTDVTSHFELDSGMKDNYYDHAKLKKKGSSNLSIDADDYFLVNFDYFTHDTSQGTGFFSVDSYPIDDVITSNANAITTEEIPLFTSPSSGKIFNLRNSLDFRPRITDTANNVTSTTNIAVNPITSTTIVEPSGGLRYPSPNEDFTTDYIYYLPRRDRIVLDPTGNPRAIRGAPDGNPQTPEPVDDAMTLCIIDVTPFPSLPPENAKRVSTATAPDGRSDLAVRIKPERNVRFTMRDIGVLKKRIENLEYYTSLSILESTAKTQIISNAAGNNRFKNGILVDDFTGHKVGNPKDPQYKIAIDQKENALIPTFKMDDVQLEFVSANSSGVVDGTNDIRLTVGAGTYSNGETISVGAASGKLVYQVGTRLYLENCSGTFNTGTAAVGGTSGTSTTVSAIQTGDRAQLITLDYEHEEVEVQPYATMTRNAAGAFYNWVGDLILNPDTDYWVDTTTAPEVVIDTAANARAIEELANGIGTIRGDFLTVFSNQRVEAFGGRRFGVVRTDQQQARDVRFETTVGEEQTQSLGERITDLSIQPFLRSRTVQITGRALKPNARLYAFFDGEDVNSFVTPANSTFANTGNEGSQLTADSNGDFFGLFRVPNEDNLRFRAGESLRFRLSDSVTNSDDPTAFTTEAFGTYHGFGQSQTRQGTILSTRPIEVNTIENFRQRTTRTVVRSWRVDPIAQSFQISPNSIDGTSFATSPGAFLTKVDLYFASRDDDTGQPAIVEIREMDPSGNLVEENVVPFSKVIVPKDDINVSTDGSAPTPIRFPTPIYLEAESTYALTIKPGGNNPNITLFTARLGETDLITGERVHKQPSAGSLFISSNDKQWSMEQQEDLKYKLYIADFGEAQNGTAVFKNRQLEFLTIANTSGNFNTIGESVHGETTITTNIALSANVGDIIVGDTSSANGTVTFSSGTTVRVKGVTLANKFTGTERVYKYAATTGANTGTTANVTSVATPQGNVIFTDFNNFSNTHLHLANTSGTFVKDQEIRGQTNGKTARVQALRNIPIDEFYNQFGRLELKGTSIKGEVRLCSTESSRDSQFRTININGLSGYDSQKFILGKSNEGSSIGGEKSAEVRLTLNNGAFKRVSPVIDNDRSAIIAIENIINNDSSNEETARQGNADARYITKTVTLADGQDAEDIKVFLDAYKPKTGNVKVYYKILNGEDGDSLDDRAWVAMTQTTSNTILSDTQSTEDYQEFEFGVPSVNLSGPSSEIQYVNSTGATYQGFKHFAIKIVLLSSTGIRTPKVRNLRVIAVQA